MFDYNVEDFIIQNFIKDSDKHAAELISKSGSLDRVEATIVSALSTGLRYNLFPA